MKVLVLPGTLWQVALVKKIKELGHQAFVVNPAVDSPCFEYADDYLQSDIFDWGKVYTYAKEKEIDALISDECDIAMNLVAKLGEALHLRTIDSQTASLYTDKFLMREFCKKNGLDHPEYKYCQTVEDALSFLKGHNSSIIIKPLDSNASHGVFKISNETELVQKFQESLSFSRHSKSVLAERYINGTEFTIDGIKTPDNHYTLAISEKKHFQHNESIANELYFTHYNDKFDYEQLKTVNDTFVMKSSLEFGFTHAEYKYEDGKFYLIEIAARGGGNMISSAITQYMSGHDTYRYLINKSLGIETESDFSLLPQYKDRVAILKFFSTPNQGGIVKDIEGLDYLESEKDIVYYKFNFKIGDNISPASNDSARIGFYIACCDNADKLEIVMNNIDNIVKINI